ncbi:substrate-binding periplasmic protein [Shewanella frigidimarina]|uniref:ABC transporter substrate-binding protein n=1 Tax=Shewanella frigidimarina TaxID=56812 RepID=A0A106BYV5_SHEFR|nr:transporter substrate-binding domain-containing protein [Shewanella frigidimarina]KVX01125.1 ABC transporter substrate-binding protein [Shewanella frigidimarina]
MKKCFIAITCFAMFFCGPTVQANTILKYNVNASSSWVPYYITESPKEPGILGELVPLLLAKADIEIEKHNFPPKRTNYALDNGLLDFDFVSPSWFPNQELGTFFVQSNPIIAIQENIITLEKKANDWQSIDNIKGKEIGTVRGYLYHDDADFIRIDFTSERDLIRALYKNRVDAAISGDLPALYWAKKLNTPIAFAAIHSKGHLVMRLRKEHVALLPRINAAIAELELNGTTQSIIDKYTKQDIFNR